MQTKTEDLYEEIKEIQEHLQSVTNIEQPRQESTPERKSRLEALASLKASIEVQISEANQKISEMDSKIVDGATVDLKI